MARRRYELQFLIDSSRAEAAARRATRALQDSEAAARRAGAAMTSAYNSAANAANSAAQRMAQASRTAAAAASRAPGGAGGAGGASSAIEDRYFKRDYDRRVQYEAQKQRQAETAAAAAQRQAGSQAAQLDSIQDRYLASDYARRVAYERRQVTQKEREAASLAKVEDRYLKDEYRRRTAFEAQKDRDAEAATARREQAILRGAQVVAAAAAVGLRVLEQGYEKIRSDAERAAEATIKLRRDLRESSSLLGAEGTTETQVLRAIKFRAQTGLGQAESDVFTQMYAGNVNIGLEKKNITQETADKLMVESGKRAARRGGDAGVHAELAGLLPMFGKIESPEQGLGQLEAIRMALTLGRGKDSPLTQQLLNTAGAMVGEGAPIATLPEMAALIGTVSLKSGAAEAGTRTEQLLRSFKAGLFKMRGGPGTKTPQGKWLKNIGVTEKDTFGEAMAKIIPDLRKAKAEGREVGGYLSEHGMRSTEERKALIEFEGNYDQFLGRTEAAKAAATPARGAAEVEANKRYMESPLGRVGVAEAAQTAAQTTRGLRGESLAAYLREAEASPEFQAGEKEIGTQIQDWIVGGLMGPMAGDYMAKGRENRLLGVAGRVQLGKARAAGVTDFELTGAQHKAYRAGSEEYTPEYFRLVDELIKSKGGSVAAEAGPAIAELTKVVEENNRLLAENNRRMGGNPPPVAPPAPAALPRP